MTNKVPMDMTWGNQTFDRSSDTVSIYRVSPDERKQTASKYFTSAVKPINYPAHKGGSQLYGTFRHGKYLVDEGEYILIRNVGTYMSTSTNYGAVIVRTRAKGSLINIDSVMSFSKDSVHTGNMPTLTVRGDVVPRKEAEQLGILDNFTRESKWSMFDKTSIEQSFKVKITTMSDQTRPPVMQKFKTKSGTKAIAVAPKASRSIRVRKKK